MPGRPPWLEKAAPAGSGSTTVLTATFISSGSTMLLAATLGSGPTMVLAATGLSVWPMPYWMVGYAVSGRLGLLGSGRIQSRKSRSYRDDLRASRRLDIN
jgi:hypothetical protein